jgi:hypothetical protein
MKTRFAIVPAAVLAFAILPSCTPTGGIDPGFTTLVGEVGDGYIRYEEMQAEREAAEYQRNLEALTIRQQQQQAAADAEMQRQRQWQMQMQPAPPSMYPAPMPPY